MNKILNNTFDVENLQNHQGFKNMKSDFAKSRFFMAVYWGMLLCMTGISTLFMLRNGFSRLEVSLAVSGYALFALVGQNVLGFMADRVGNVRRIMLVSISAGLLIAYALSIAVEHWQMLALIWSWAFFLTGTVPLADAWVIGMLKKTGSQRRFGEIRGLGSIGYAISGVALGFILEKIGWDYYYWYIASSVLITLLSIFIIKDDNSIALYKVTGDKTVEKKGEETGRGGSRSGIKIGEVFRAIIRIRELRNIIIIMFMYIFFVRGIYSYLAVMISDLGGGAINLGYTYFFDAAPEIVTFFLASKLLARFEGRWLILAALLLQVLRLVLIFILNNTLSIILLGALGGFSYGLIASAYKTQIYELAPARFKISCVSLSESLIGLAGLCSVPVFGFVIAEYGGRYSVGIGLGLAVITVAFILKTQGFGRKSRLNEGIKPG